MECGDGAPVAAPLVGGGDWNSTWLYSTSGIPHSGHLWNNAVELELKLTNILKLELHN